MPHWLFLPDDAVGDLAVLSELSAAKIGALRSHLDSQEFRPTYRFYTKVAELLDITDEAAARLCTFVNYVQSQRVKRSKAGTLRDGAAVVGELEAFLARIARKKELKEEALRVAEFVRANHALLAGLFSDLPKHDFSEKVRGLESGPLPHLHAFRTYLDLRPVYDLEANAILQEFPVITLGFTIHSTPEDKYREVVIQLAEDDLAELRDQLKRLDRKLALLKKRHNLTANPDGGRGSHER